MAKTRGKAINVVTIFAVFIIVVIFVIIKNPSKVPEWQPKIGQDDSHSSMKHLMSSNLSVKKYSPPETDGNNKQQMKRKKRFPDAIIIGVKKGGTRALIAMLKTHPGVQISQHEVHYFSYEYNRSLKWYVSQMPQPISNNTVIMEKSPSYFVSEQAPIRIYHDQPKPTKLILIVRNPVVRAISDYAHVLTKTKLPNFEEMVIKDDKVNVSTPIVFKSWYDVHFKNWLKWFKRSEILVVDGDQLIKDPVSVLKKAEAFLKLDHFFRSDMFIRNPEKGFYCWKTNKEQSMPTCLGATKGRPHPKVDKNVIMKLNQHYSSHMKKFCTLASVNFTWCDLQV